MTKKKTKIALILGFIAIAILSVLIIATMSKLNSTIETREIGWTAYTVSSINTTSGKLEESKLSIATDDYITVDGLTIEVAEDAELSYKVFFYDEDYKFLSTFDSEGEVAFSIPTTAEYVRVQITPAEDADGQISLFELRDLAKQVTITVNK